MKIFFHLMLFLYLSAALVSLLFARTHRFANIIANLFSMAASLCGVAFSLSFFAGTTKQITLLSWADSVPYLAFSLNADSLSAFFIFCLTLLAFCVSLYSLGYLQHYYGSRPVGLFNLLYNLFLLSMALLFTSRNIISFLVFWELMSLFSYALVVFEAEHPENSRAGLLYLIMTHLGTAFLVVAFMLIYQYTGSLEIGPAGSAIPPFWQNVVFVLLLVGFGIKAGVIPLHIWLPYAHPAAPSNVSALMSGIMIKTAVYGLIRFVLIVLGASAPWWGTVVLLAGAVSAVLGVAYALMEHNFKRLLAYHSIENIGIILIGLGISLYAAANHHPAAAGLALLASLFHLLNHTLFKGALFLGAGSLHYATHTKDIEELGGLMKKMPYTGFLFILASLSISAIPPFNGFVSEWLTYQSLFLNLTLAGSGLKLLSMLAVAALALAGALAAACFVKLIGISFLGLPRSEHAKEAMEVPYSMLAGMGILTFFCLIFGIFPRLVTVPLDRVNGDLLAVSVLPALQGDSFFLYYPLEFNGSLISPASLLLFGLVLFAAVVAVVKLLGGKTGEKTYGTWDCGFGTLNSHMQYSATGFSKPIRIVFRGLYRPTRELQCEPGPSPYYHQSMRYVVSTQPIFEKYFYHPVTRSFTCWARKVRLAVQTGSVHTYLVYIFVALVALLLYNRLG